jgi:prepilin-type N-terminal cleavage/methylation domain-containing protein
MNKKGFTLVEIMIVVLIIGLLAAIAIPNFIKARKTTQTNACIDNMRVIAGAVEQYRMEGKGDPEVVADLCGADNYIKVEPYCPVTRADEEPYTLEVVGDDLVPKCPNDATYADHVLPTAVAGAGADGAGG